MKQRLQPDEIRTIRSQCQTDELYHFIADNFIQFERDMSQFDMCPEEVFLECKDILNEILSVGEKYDGRADLLWHRLYNDYRRIGRNVDDTEISLAVCLVMMAVTIGLFTSKHFFYSDTLPLEMMNAIMHNTPSLEKVVDHIIDAEADYGDALDGWLEKYMAEKVEKPFEKFVLHKNVKKELIDLLHSYIDNQTKPRFVLRGLRAAIDAKTLDAPDIESFNIEFNKKVSKSSYQRYITNPGDHPYKDDKSFGEIEKEFEKLIR